MIAVALTIYELFYAIICNFDLALLCINYLYFDSLCFINNYYHDYVSAAVLYFVVVDGLLY